MKTNKQEVVVKIRTCVIKIKAKNLILLHVFMIDKLRKSTIQFPILN